MRLSKIKGNLNRVLAILLLILPVVVFLFVVQTRLFAAGNTYYVSKTSCSDSYVGSEAQPWCTIQHAATTITGGDTVNISVGTYSERVTITSGKSGTAQTTTKFIANGTVIVSQGFVVNSSYTDLTGLEVTPGGSVGGITTGQLHITGDNNLISNISVHDTTNGSAVVFTSGAANNIIQNYTIDTVAGFGINFDRSYLTNPETGAVDNQALNGTISHHKGSSAVYLDGARNTVDGITINGGPSGADAGSIDGDGIRVNGPDMTIKNFTIHNLWEWYNSGQHTDGIQFYTGDVGNLLIENGKLGTWEPSAGYDTGTKGPSQLIMAENNGTGFSQIPTNVTINNVVFMGEPQAVNGDGVHVAINFNNGSPLYVNFYVNNCTFWGLRMDTAGGGRKSYHAYNNIFTMRHDFSWDDGLRQYEGDSNLYVTAPNYGSVVAPKFRDGIHSIIGASPLFTNPDSTLTTDYGLTADLTPQASSLAVDAGDLAHAPVTDLLGFPRDATPDIGAYEYQGVSVPTYSVIYNGNGNTGGTVPSDVNTYEENDTVTVLGNTGSLVKTGYSFAGWNTAVDGSGTNCAPADTFSMPAVNTTLYAKWTINSYTLTYNGNGNTGGTSPTDPSSPYDYNVSVTTIGNTGDLVKTGYSFAGWNTAVDGSGADRTPASTFSMPAANTVLYAKWSINTYTITASSGANGAVTPSGVTTKDYGSSQVYAVTPQTHYHIVDVLVDDVSVGSGSSYTFSNIQSNHTISATFAIDTFTLTTSANPPAGGTTSGDGTYNYNTSHDLVASANAGYTFDHWSGACGGTDATVSVLATSDILCIANFTLDSAPTFTLTLNILPTSSGTVTGNGSYNEGETATITALPAANYTFASWSGDCSGTDNPTTLVMDAAKTCTASFTAIHVYDITSEKLTHNEGGVSFSFVSLPVGVSGIDIVVTPSDTTIHTLPSGKTLSRLFDIVVTDQDGNPVVNDLDIGITFTYTGVKSSDTVLYWNGIAWSNTGISNVVPNVSGGNISFSTTHFTEYAVFADAVVPNGTNIQNNSQAGVRTLPSTGEQSIPLLFVAALGALFVFTSGRRKPVYAAEITLRSPIQPPKVRKTVDGIYKIG